MKYIAGIIFTILLVASQLSFGHGGGLDANGGHNDRKNGTYHCHKAPCTENFAKADTELNAAVTEQRPLSLIYNRSDWKHWSDFDSDCINTRHEILISQSLMPVKLSPNGCYVSSGTWLDPYSGKTFTRASDLDIDHIIPLKWAHDHGGAAWSLQMKEQYANDQVNLLAVDDGLNQQKSAQGPDTWMPPNHQYRCDYLERWVTVMSKYPSLKFNAGEQRIFNRQRSACGKI